MDQRSLSITEVIEIANQHPHPWVDYVRQFQEERLHNEIPSFPTWDGNADKRIQLSIQHLDEEVRELEEATDLQDLAGVVDGVVDLIYYAIGMVLQLGVDITPHFCEVHLANMEKKHNPYAVPGREKRVVKPLGWQEPRITEILIEQGANL